MSSVALSVYLKHFLILQLKLLQQIKIEGYNLKRTDFLGSKIKGGSGVCYKDYLPVVRRDGLCMLEKL